MSKTIVLWGVILCGCVCLPQTLFATSLEWEAGREYIKFDLTARLVFSPLEMPILGDLRMVQGSPESVVVTTNRFQAEALKVTETHNSVLALPESGTLILLGLGPGWFGLIDSQKGKTLPEVAQAM